MKVARLFLLLLMLAVPLGCGGGSSGTDGGTAIKILGIVQDPQGMPVNNSHITLLENGESVTSDATGHFEILAPRSDSYSFEVVAGTLPLQVILRDVDISNEVVSIVITVDAAAGEIRIDQAALVPLETPTAEPTVGSPSTGPRPRPTAVVDQRSIISGNVINQDRQPVKGIEITLVGTSVADQTSTDGTFSLRSRIRTNSIELRIESDQLAGFITISGLPRTPFRLQLTLQVRERSNIVGGELEIIVEEQSILRR